MLKEFLAFWEGLRGNAEPQEPGPDDIRLIAAALIVHLAEIDGAFSAREAAWLRGTVETYTGLTGDDADRFIALADRTGREISDIADFVAPLRRRLPPDQKLQLLALMWRMALADGVLHEFEEDLISRVADMLGLSEPEADAIREAALHR
jgi:uncharacterized tellurite resistance protein B-like protein